jgi:hypothetical protein
VACLPLVCLGVVPVAFVSDVVVCGPPVGRLRDLWVPTEPRLSRALSPNSKSQIKFGVKLARGPACLRRTPHSQRHQPACKPGFVGHRLLAQTIRDGHSSGTTFARCLEQPTRTASLTSPCGVIAFQRTSRLAVPIRFCSRCGLPCRFRCRTRGALLPHLFTLARHRSFHCYGKRFILCGTVPGVAPAGRYPAPYVDGARTFLSSHLSAIAGAAVRPTDVSVMGAQARRVKPAERFRAKWLPVRVKKTRQNKIEPRF